MSKNSDSMGLDEFIGHSTSGGRNNYLKSWKKQGWIEVWLHKQASFVALWRHQLPIIRAFEDRDTKQITRRIWTQQFNCLESESVLIDQRKRDKKTGEREVPPAICPVCLLLEDVYQRVWAGRDIVRRAEDEKDPAAKEKLKVEWKESRALALTTPIFRFQLDDEDLDPEERLVELTAGGVCDLYKPDAMSDAEKAAVKKARIRLDEAWKESAAAKCSYVFTVVDDAHPETGVQIAIETSLLGEKVKNVIIAERRRIGRDDGNPLKNPYPIRWEHYPKEKEVQKKYQAFALSTTGERAHPLTDAIRDLIEGDPPDISRLKRKGNAASLRTQLEQYALVDFDWDALFGQAEKLQASSAEEGDDASFDYGANAAPAEKEPERKEPEANGKKRVAKEPSAAKPEAKTIPCDKCKHPMAEDATKCPKCGTEYDLVDEPQALPPAPGYKGGPVHNEADAGQAGDELPWIK